MTFSAGLFCGQAKQSNNRWNITVSNQQCKLLKYKKSCTQPPAGWLKSCQKISDFKYFPCAWWAWVWTLHTHAVCRGLCGLQCGHYGGCLWRCLADILLRILWYWFMISGWGGTRPAPPHDCVFVSASAIVALRSPRQLLCSSRGYHNYNHWLASRIEVTWSVHGRHSREVLDKERGMFFCLFSLMIYAMVDI